MRNRSDRQKLLRNYRYLSTAIRMNGKSKNGITKADRGSQYTRAAYNSLSSLTFFPLLLILPWLNVFFKFIIIDPGCLSPAFSPFRYKKQPFCIPSKFRKFEQNSHAKFVWYFEQQKAVAFSIFPQTFGFLFFIGLNFAT